MTDKEIKELEIEMAMLESLKNNMSKDEFCAMYYMALSLISDQLDIDIIQVHNELIIDQINGTLELIPESGQRAH